jgi:hypothetical protein
MFREVPLSIIRSLLTAHSAMVYVIKLSSRSMCSCSKAVYKPVGHIPLLSLQWTNSWWWTEELPETCRISRQNKFVKLVHQVGFIIKKIQSTYCTYWTMTFAPLCITPGMPTAKLRPSPCKQEVNDTCCNCLTCMYSSLFFDTCNFLITVACITIHAGVPTQIVLLSQHKLCSPLHLLYLQPVLCFTSSISSTFSTSQVQILVTNY